MGSGSYSFTSRAVRSENLGYTTKSVNDIFEQNKKRQIHESMSPYRVIFREARDSAEHPNSVPIILQLDVTGSMGNIPHKLIKDGLPHLMSSIIQGGVPDPQLLFIAVGDHEVDRFPLQVGQFESADLELDTWLTRTYLEGGGGGNAGESYLLSYYFAAFHTITDSYEKRKQKGFLFTIGDEPGLTTLPLNVVKELMGSTPQAQNHFTDKQLLALAQVKYNVYNLQILETNSGSSSRTREYWNDLLGQNNILVEHHSDIPKIISKIVLDNLPRVSSVQTIPVISDTTSITGETPIIL